MAIYARRANVNVGGSLCRHCEPSCECQSGFNNRTKINLGNHFTLRCRDANNTDQGAPIATAQYSGCRLGSRLVTCDQAMHPAASQRRILALAQAARAFSEGQTGNDVAHVFDALLRSRRFAGVRSGRNAYAAQQAQPVRVPERSQRACNLRRSLVHRSRSGAGLISVRANMLR